MDDRTKLEIIDAFQTALANVEAHLTTAHDETHALVEKVVGDQVEMRAELATVRVRIEALEASRNAHEARLSGHERRIIDGIAEAKREASEAEARMGATLAAVDRHVGAIQTEMKTWKEDASTAVLSALQEHVSAIEEAADRLTKSPRVRTAASIGGAFAGSAVVTGIIELLKHL